MLGYGVVIVLSRILPNKALTTPVYTLHNNLKSQASHVFGLTKPRSSASRFRTLTNCNNRLRPTSTTNMATMNSSSADRNKEPIWSILSTLLQESITTSSTTATLCEEIVNDDKQNSGFDKNEKTPYNVLEIAAGCGVHTLYFASKLVNNFEDLNLSWYPTDPDELSRCSIQDRTSNAVSKLVRESIKSPVSITLTNDGILEQCGESYEYMENDCVGAEISLQQMMGKFNLITCINMIHISPWEATVGLMKVASSYLSEGGILYCYGPYKINGTAVESNLNFDLALRARDPTWGVRNIEDVIELAVINGLSLDRTVEMPANNLSVIFRKKCK